MEINEPLVQLLSITPNSEKLIEEAGRTCYLSLDKIAEGTERNFIKNCIKRGHFSILEHSSATFRILGGSRAFTHQIVRHRIGVGISQQSQRFIDENNFNFIVPPKIANNPQAYNIFCKFILLAQTTYTQLREFGISKEDARFVLPNALESQMVFTANFREFRHIFSLRLHKTAQWEIRRICYKMLEILQEHAPAVFDDFQKDKNNFTATSVS